MNNGTTGLMPPYSGRPPQPPVPAGVPQDGALYTSIQEFEDGSAIVQGKDGAKYTRDAETGAFRPYSEAAPRTGAPPAPPPTGGGGSFTGAPSAGRSATSQAVHGWMAGPSRWAIF